MDLIPVVLLFGSLCALMSCAPSDSKTIEKRSAGSSPEISSFDDNDMAKRVFRYGKRVFRYGKRPAVFRYGKRSDEFADSDLFDQEDKRVFRYGKRDMDEDKRVFRFGKRDGERERRVFRYGKRSDMDEDELEAIKRKTFRFGKRFDDGQVLLDYQRDTRANEPHVPFRFGDE